MTIELDKWLNEPCNLGDLLELSKEIFYMPIGVVKKKIHYMEDKFNVNVLETSFHHFLFNTNQRETIASGSICITIMQSGNMIAQLIGAATFNVADYGDNKHYAATLESLCIVNAFGGKYPQFGSAFNKIDVVPGEKTSPQPPAPDTSKEMDEVFRLLKKRLNRFKFREEAQEYLNGTQYKNNLEAKGIVDLLPLKNK